MCWDASLLKFIDPEIGAFNFLDCIKDQKLLCHFASEAYASDDNQEFSFRPEPFDYNHAQILYL